jgi:hypothetical protein
VSVSVVNGYVCFSGCDEAKARSGKNPHPKPGQSEFARPGVSGADNPAVTFGGRLAAANGVAPIDKGSNANAARLPSSGSAVDIIV